MKLRQKIFNFIIRHMSFPNECKSSAEHNWMLKNNCPACIAQPIEYLSNSKYHEKYPANNRINIGVTTIYLCDIHLEELKHILNSSDGVKMRNKLKEYRCVHCGRLLGRFSGQAEIKCPKCGKMNVIGGKSEGEEDLQRTKNRENY